MIQDSHGRFVFVDASGGKVRVAVSRDGYHWEEASRWSFPGASGNLSILQRSDGMYELFTSHAVCKAEKWTAELSDLYVERGLRDMKLPGSMREIAAAREDFEGP